MTGNRPADRTPHRTVDRAGWCVIPHVAHPTLTGTMAGSRSLYSMVVCIPGEQNGHRSRADTMLRHARPMTDRSRTRLPRPSDVAGFAAAASAGLTPARPTTPPHIAGRPTARRAFRRLVATLAVSVAATVGCLLLLPDDRIAGKGAIAYVSTIAVGYVATRASVRRFRAIFLDELQAGYATTTFTQGLFWLPVRGAGRPTWGDDVVGWDWDGLWVLDTDGNVVSVPDPSVDPPGLYPSPHIPGHLELWTGYRWTGVFPNR